MKAKLNHFYVRKKNLSLELCTEEKDFHCVLTNSSSLHLMCTPQYIEENFIELEFNCESDPTISNHGEYHNYQSITEFFDLILHNCSYYSTSNYNFILHHNNTISIVSMDYNKHKYIAKAENQIAIIENIRRSKVKTLHEKIIALRSTGIFG